MSRGVLPLVSSLCGKKGAITPSFLGALLPLISPFDLFSFTL